MLALMFPTHVAMGYLIGVYSRLPVVYLVVGSALPDLLDRPLYYLGVTPLPHTVGHSLFVAVPVCALAVYFWGDRGVALAVGWLAHLLTDALNVLTTQGPAMAPYYVLYPLERPDTRRDLWTVTIELPVTDVTHTVTPVVLGAETVLLAAAGWVCYRRGKAKGVFPHPRNHEPE